jgi:hypothetical protein
VDTGGAPMDGSELVFIVMPIVIPLALGIMVALPFVADRVWPTYREHAREPERADMRWRAREPTSPVTAPAGWPPASREHDPADGRAR